MAKSRSPGSPPWAGQGPNAGRGRPLAELSLERGAGGVIAEATRKAIRAPRPDSRGEEGLPCSTGPSPSWPRPPRFGRLCPGTQHHSSFCNRRPLSFRAAITASLEKIQRLDVSSVDTPAARPREGAAAMSANPEPKLGGDGHQSQSHKWRWGGASARPGGRRKTPSGHARR